MLSTSCLPDVFTGYLLYEAQNEMYIGLIINWSFCGTISRSFTSYYYLLSSLGQTSFPSVFRRLHIKSSALRSTSGGLRAILMKIQLEQTNLRVTEAL